MNSSQTMLAKVVFCATGILIAGYLLQSGYSSSSNIGGKPVQDEQVSVQSTITEVMAVEEARKACGIAKATDVSSVLIRDPGKIVPYIAPEKSVWRVRFKSVKFGLSKGGAPDVSPHVTVLDVYVSPSTGRVMAAVSLWPDNVEGVRFPSIKGQEEQMEQISETFVGLPSTSPRITLADAFQIDNHVHNAKQVIAYQVIQESRSTKVPNSVWVIHAWGTSPFLPHGGPPEAVPEDARNHMRTEINTDTGEWYGWNTIPQPSDSPTDKTYDQERP